MKSFKINVLGKDRSIRFNNERMKFEYTLPYKDINGKYKNSTIRTNSIEELSNKIIEFEANIIHPNNNNITLRSYIQYYLTNVCPTINQTNTIKLKKSILDNLPKDLLDNKLSNITPMMLQNLYAILHQNKANNTVKYYHQVLTTVFNNAIKDGIIKNNPNNLCKVQNYRTGKKIYLSPEECQKILSFTKKEFPFLYKPFLFLIVTGCRRGECLGLKKQYVNKKQLTINIAGQITNMGYSTRLKTNASYRTLKITKKVMDIITQDWDENSEFVFTYNSEPWQASLFNYYQEKCFKAYGQPEISVKQFRNSFVKTAILNNVSLKVLQNILGHAKQSTTADIYGELLTEDTFMVANIFNNFV